MRRYYISQRFCITLCVGITFRNVYYIMRFNTRHFHDRDCDALLRSDSLTSVYTWIRSVQNDRALCAVQRCQITRANTWEIYLALERINCLQSAVCWILELFHFKVCVLVWGGGGGGGGVGGAKEQKIFYEKGGWGFESWVEFLFCFCSSPPPRTLNGTALTRFSSANRFRVSSEVERSSTSVICNTI